MDEVEGSGPDLWPLDKVPTRQDQARRYERSANLRHAHLCIMHTQSSANDTRAAPSAATIAQPAGGTALTKTVLHIGARVLRHDGHARVTAGAWRITIGLRKMVEGIGNEMTCFSDRVEQLRW